MVNGYKTFNKSEFDTIYAEREWRSVESFKFGWKDIDALLLPKLKGYYDIFKETWRNKLGVPSKIQIFSWDDL